MNEKGEVGRAAPAVLVRILPSTESSIRNALTAAPLSFNFNAPLEYEMITINEIDPKELAICRSCSTVHTAKFEIEVKKTPDEQQANRSAPFFGFL